MAHPYDCMHGDLQIHVYKLCLCRIYFAHGDILLTYTVYVHVVKEAISF